MEDRAGVTWRFSPLSLTLSVRPASDLPSTSIFPGYFFHPGSLARPGIPTARRNPSAPTQNHLFACYLRVCHTCAHPYWHPATHGPRQITVAPRHATDFPLRLSLNIQPKGCPPPRAFSSAFHASSPRSHPIRVSVQPFLRFASVRAPFEAADSSRRESASREARVALGVDRNLRQPRVFFLREKFRSARPRP